jgi:hypothetical protein
MILISHYNNSIGGTEMKKDNERDFIVGVQWKGHNLEEVQSWLQRHAILYKYPNYYRARVRGNEYSVAFLRNSLWEDNTLTFTEADYDKVSDILSHTVMLRLRTGYILALPDSVTEENKRDDVRCVISDLVVYTEGKLVVADLIDLANEPSYAAKQELNKC